MFHLHLHSIEVARVLHLTVPIISVSLKQKRNTHWSSILEVSYWCCIHSFSIFHYHTSNTIFTEQPRQKHDTSLLQGSWMTGAGVSVNNLQLSLIFPSEICQNTTYRPKYVRGAGVQAVSAHQKPAATPTVETYCILTGLSSASLFCNMRLSVPKLPWKWVSVWEQLEQAPISLHSVENLAHPGYPGVTRYTSSLQQPISIALFRSD